MTEDTAISPELVRELREHLDLVDKTTTAAVLDVGERTLDDWRARHRAELGANRQQGLLPALELERVA